VAQVLTDNLRQDILRPDVSPLIVAKIDGYPFLLGNIQIYEFIRIGDPGLFVGNDWNIGGIRPIDNQKTYLSFDQGTTTKISQKIDPSKGVGTSVTQMTLALLDYNEEMSQLVSPGTYFPDILGRRVTIFAGTKDTSFPEDYNPIFRGVIQSLSSNPTTIFLNLNSTEEKKRVSALPRIQSETASGFDYKSVQFQDILFKNREDVQNLITINYLNTGTAGSETVTLSGGGFTIDVSMQSGVSTASQIKKAIENTPASNQLVTLKITLDSANPQTSGTAALNTASVLSLVDASQFLEPVDILETLFTCEDELIQYTAVSGNTLTGCTRGVDGSVAAFHDIEKTVDQVARLTDNGINVALKLMLSQGPAYYVENLPVVSVQYYTPAITIDNAIFFDGIDVMTDYGVVPGDLITVTGSVVPGNNITDSIILDVSLVNNGSYIVVADNLATEGTSVAVVKIKSQFNTLPFGFGMRPSEVDIDQHLFIRDTYLTTLPMSFDVKDISDGKTFLEKQVYLPMNCISVLRKGRSSIVYTVGPMPNYEVVPFDTTTVENPEQLKVERSLNENFINQIQFDYDYDVVSGKYLTRKNYPDVVNTATIDILAKPLLIQSQGLRTDSDALIITERSAERWLNRYERGAEYIKGVKVIFSRGFPLENGDIVAVDFADLKLTDYDEASRSGNIKLMEIQNYVLDYKTAEVTVDLVNTTFGVGDRFGVISPSSLVGTGSTTTKVILQKSWSTKPYQTESRKWTTGGYVNQQIIIHSEDWSTVYTTFIRGFDNNDPQGMLVDVLPAPPASGWIIQCPDYPSDMDQSNLAFWKQRHAFFSPRVSVVVGVSTTRFTVAALDVTKFFVGSIIRVHNFSFSVDSPEVEVIEINGNDIIVDLSLGFVPTNQELVDLIGFPDKQQSYRVV